MKISQSVKHTDRPSKGTVNAEKVNAVPERIIQD